MMFDLRDFRPADDNSLFLLLNNPGNVLYVPMRRPDTRAEARQILGRYITSEAVRYLAVVHPEYPSLLLGLFMWQVRGLTATIGIVSDTANPRARGVARIVAGEFTRQALATGKVHRVESYAHIENKAAQAATLRYGARLVGVARKYAIFPNISETEPQDCCLFEVTK